MLVSALVWCWRIHIFEKIHLEAPRPSNSMFFDGNIFLYLCSAGSANRLNIYCITLLIPTHDIVKSPIAGETGLGTQWIL